MSADYLTKLFGLIGKTAIITGATGGLGLSIAIALANAGARIVSIELPDDPNSDKLNKSVYAASGLNCSKFVCELRDAQALRTGVANIWDSGISPDVLVNCAGFMRRNKCEHATDEEFNLLFELNVRATYIATQEFGRKLIALERPGKVIIIASITAHHANINTSVYASTKAAAVQMTKAFSNEWASKGIQDTSDFAAREFHQMTVQTERDREMLASETLKDQILKPSNRNRIFCACFTMFGAESTGILVVYNYSVLLYEGLGYSVGIPLLLAAAYVTVACCGNYINYFLIDPVGRANLPVIGMTGCMISSCFESALNATYVGTTNSAGLGAAVFFLFLYITFYGCCIDANTFVYCSEIFPTHTRSRGMAFSVSVLFLGAMVYLEAAPTAFADIGWKFHLLFIALTAINTSIIWYSFPETKGRSLEEISGLFGEEVIEYLQDTVQKQEVEKVETAT